MRTENGLPVRGMAGVNSGALAMTARMSASSSACCSALQVARQVPQSRADSVITCKLFAGLLRHDQQLPLENRALRLRIRPVAAPRTPHYINPDNAQQL